MLGPWLALSSALVYGVVDYAGGILSRRVHFAVVSFVGQLGALLAACVAAVLAGPGDVLQPADLGWGALSGLGSATTMYFLNRGVSRGALSIVMPISAVTGVALSVGCGVVVLHERPGTLAWTGILLVPPALWCITRGRVSRGRGAVRDGLIASCGVAVQYVALGLASPDSGLWPVAVGRVVAVIALVPALRSARMSRVRAADHARAGLIGAGATLGLVLYVLAARQEMLAVAVVIASLYPAIPVLLGVTVHHERLGRTQALGLVAAGIAVALLSIG
ncbi:EamA family transporter [Promicromonospora sp. NPDC059942]|uniref:EamA family transporter n=1 Tax=Promicromonospora sp. NPDC059942 TaxID=3347009 RepID=UPI0036465D1A